MRFAGFLLLGCLLCPIHAVGKIKKDTIYTTDGDRIILSYDIVNTTNQATIKFIGQQKKLGRLNSKYCFLTEQETTAVMYLSLIWFLKPL